MPCILYDFKFGHNESTVWNVTVSNLWIKFRFVRKKLNHRTIEQIRQIASRVFFLSIFYRRCEPSSPRLRARPSIIVRFIYDPKERVTICPRERERNPLAPSHRSTIKGVELSSSLRVGYYVQLAWDAGRERGLPEPRKVCLRSDA
jgi:hypothetical protein